MNLCRACGQDFSSVEAFDRHRVGAHTYTYDAGLLLDPPRHDGRRCLNLDEMARAGWVLDARGRWVHPRELRKRLSRGGDSPTEPTPTPPAPPQPTRRTTSLPEAITAPRTT